MFAFMSAHQNTPPTEILIVMVQLSTLQMRIALIGNTFHLQTSLDDQIFKSIIMTEKEE